MEFYLRSLSDRPYRIASPDKLSTPSLLLFRDRFEHNIKRMRELLASTSSGFGLESIWPHVKTHKSSWVTKQLMKQGVWAFKTTPNEVDMLIAAGVQTIFIAYPLTLTEAFRIAKLAEENRHIQILVQASKPEHIYYLSEAAKRHHVKWNYFIDVDVGMHRTGIHPGKTLDFFRRVEKTRFFEFVGFHAYDGHNDSADLEARRKTSKVSVGLLAEAIRQFEKYNLRVPKLMMGGTPSFLPDLEYLSELCLDTDLILSPGTWIYFDSQYARIMPNTFDVAACILAQVIDKPASNTATLNLGYKRWAIDQGPIDSFSVEGMIALSWDEEHTVVSVPESSTVDIGNNVLIAPRHVCSTVNLWERMTIIDLDGEIEIPDCPIDGRNR